MRILFCGSEALVLVLSLLLIQKFIPALPREPGLHKRVQSLDASYKIITIGFLDD